MKAWVEMPKGVRSKPSEEYRYVEMGEPVCGEDFCDGCGDCLECQGHDSEDWCPSGSFWVIYYGLSYDADRQREAMARTHQPC